MRRSALVTDFDGTITQRDFYLLLAERFIPSSEPDYLEEYRQGRLTHFEAMQGYFDYTPEEPAELGRLLLDVSPDPELSSAVRRLEQAGWDLIIVSAGSSWYIDRILKQAGIEATVHANPGEIVPGRGLVMQLPRESLFFSPEVGIDKSAVLRDAQARYETVAFAGDGPPDLPPALLTRPDLRFARGWLADALREREEFFQAFGRWSEVVTRLLH
ncbi:MAG TPA: HAD-IB family phosphatase [Bryobacteraceae bacterium]|nr:HAD-IB family phosphatase [Bryobacteraceae bacterium]